MTLWYKSSAAYFTTCTSIYYHISISATKTAVINPGNHELLTSITRFHTSTHLDISKF